jgi:hypothetical protein
MKEAMMKDSMVSVLAALFPVAFFAAVWLRNEACNAEDAARDMRMECDRLVDRIAAMERCESKERAAGAKLHQNHKALRHRFASVLGEARAWRKRALALGWTKGGA